MKNLNKTKTILWGILILILLGAVFFPYSIKIVDALTLETVSDFNIHIPFIRLLFEPFLGLLLFFNRSLYPLHEFQLLLYWILLVFSMYRLVQFFSISNKKNRNAFLWQQFLNLPIVGGLWFVAFVVVLFIPLPNNTLVNLSPNAVVVNTHSHTEFSHDGLMSPKKLWKWHQRNGFDAFYITDHNNHNETFDFVEAQRNNEFPNHPLVLCGEEFSGSNHLSLLGLKSKFITRGLNDSVVVAFTKAENGAVLVNHWFDGEHQTLDYYKNLGADGFEIENTGTDRTYSREVFQRIRTFCETNRLLMVGGVDFHGYGNVCSLWNAFEIPGWRKLDSDKKESAILQVLKERDQTKIRVLLYNDRPYYSSKFLLFRPPLTFFAYFRTLNFFQYLSWILWILLLVLLRNKMKSNSKWENNHLIHQIIPASGILGALFLLTLGLHFYFSIKEIENFTEMYLEYSNLLFLIGGIFLFYATLVFFIKKRKHL